MLAMLLAAPGGVFAQESVQAMFTSIPAPPATAAAADAWLASAAVKGLPGKIAAQRTGIEKLMAAAAASQQPAGMPEDFARAARDPAYAKELQARIAKMSQAEQMAFAKRMSEATSAGALRDVQAMANESPAVKTAVDAFLAYQQRQMSMSALIAASTQITAVRDRVSSRETAIASAAEKKLQCSDGEGGCPSKVAEEADNRVLREAWTQIVAEYDRGLVDINKQIAAVRQARSADIAEGQRHMAATSFGTAAQSATNRQQLANYHNALLIEVEQLLQLSKDTAEWAASRYKTHAINFHPFK